MTESGNRSSRCFSGILRRLICTGSLPTHPDLISDSNKTTNFDHHPEKDLKDKLKPQAQATPGVVARLMGLDSLPEIDWVPRQRTTLESILRSRSVNSVDFAPEFDPTQGQHRRARTSVSFREVPTYLQQENRDFFVLCVEKVGGTNKMSLGLGKSEMGLDELKQGEAGGERNRGNSREREFEMKMKKDQENKEICKRKEEPIRVKGKRSTKMDYNFNLRIKNKAIPRQSRETMKGKSVAKPMNLKKTAEESRLRREKKSRQASRKVQPVSNSENSSPLSVLDRHHTLTNTSPEDTESRNSSPRRKPESDDDTNYENPCSKSTVPTFVADDYALRGEREIRFDEKPWMSTAETYCYKRLVNEVWCSAEEDIRDSKWMTDKQVIKSEDYEELCAVFGQQILDLLFYEVIDDLVECN